MGGDLDIATVVDAGGSATHSGSLSSATCASIDCAARAAVIPPHRGTAVHTCIWGWPVQGGGGHLWPCDAESGPAPPNSKYRQPPTHIIIAIDASLSLCNQTLKMALCIDLCSVLRKELFLKDSHVPSGNCSTKCSLGHASGKVVTPLLSK